MLHRIGARVWISRILITWGVIAVGTGFVQNIQQLVVARFLLGLAEAGFFPGMLLYLTYWFRQREQAQAMAILVSAQPVTNILGAPVSGLVLDHIHWLGIDSWRWLLVLEGLPAVVGGMLVLYFLPSRPADATFLADEERGWLVAALARENQPRAHTHSFRLLLTGPVLRLAAIGFTQASAAYSLTFWLPQVVKAISSQSSNTAVGLLVAIPYCAALVSLLVVSLSSDRSQERRLHAGVPLLVGGLAYMLLAVVHTSTTSLVLLTVAAIGMWGYFGPCFAIPGQLLAGTAAATGLAFITSIANLGGFAGPYVVGLVGRATGSTYSGLALAGVSLWISAALILSLPATVNGRPHEPV
jgi:MFS family permease